MTPTFRHLILLLSASLILGCTSDDKNDPGTDTSTTLDSTSGDTGSADTGSADTGAADTNPADTNSADTGSADTNAGDTNAGDTNVADTSTADTSEATCSDFGSTDACFSNYDCTDTGQRCEDLANDPLFPVACCTDGARGSGAAGDTCTDENDCASGVCITKDDVNYYCSDTCESIDDCPTGMKDCVSLLGDGWCFPE